MLMETWIVRFCLLAACILIAGILFVMYQKKRRSREDGQKSPEENPEADSHKTQPE